MSWMVLYPASLIRGRMWVRNSLKVPIFFLLRGDADVGFVDERKFRSTAILIVFELIRLGRVPDASGPQERPGVLRDPVCVGGDAFARSASPMDDEFVIIAMMKQNPGNLDLPFARDVVRIVQRT